MSLAAITPIRSPDGRFPPGVSGNPAGRPKGARNKTTRIAEALEEGDAETLLRLLVDKAKAGDGVALRFLVARLFPMPKGAPVTLDLAPGAETDPVAVFDTAIRAMADGAITPDDALAIARTLQKRPKSPPPLRRRPFDKNSGGPVAQRREGEGSRETDSERRPGASLATPTPMSRPTPAPESRVTTPLPSPPELLSKGPQGGRERAFAAAPVFSLYPRPGSLRDRLAAGVAPVSSLFPRPAATDARWTGSNPVV